jgi:hypothetical protein
LKTIRIKQNGLKLEIESNDHLILSGRLKKRFWSSVWKFVDDESQLNIAFKILSKYFKFDYNLLILCHDEEFNLKFNHAPPNITFQVNSDEYLIIFHTGTRISLFKNQKQCASLSKKKVYIKGKKTFKGLVDDTIDTEICLIIFCALVLIDEMESSDYDADFIIDFGNFSKELKPFDERWNP